VAVTATFRQIYVFVVMHHGSRRLLHFNVTMHSTADWTLQQLRQTFGPDDAFRFLLHDRDSIFPEGLNRSIEAFGLRVLKSPPRSPKANALCERLIGAIRRECLDWLIPLSEHHLRSLLKMWAVHYNRSRPHMRLGPGIPDPLEHRVLRTNSARGRQQVGGFTRLRVKSILGDLHHDYDWALACI
jgi:transposase InsO family protein